MPSAHTLKRQLAVNVYGEQRMSTDNKGPTSIPEPKQEVRNRITKDTKAFLDKGNKIQVAPPQKYSHQEHFTVSKKDATRRTAVKNEK